jgi:transcriptional regulator with XRE-family HTH domain
MFVLVLSPGRLLSLTGTSREVSMPEAAERKQSFADKLAYLIATVHPPDRGPYSYREIAAGIEDHEGAMTAAFIQQLSTGKQPYPRMHHLAALASFFGVPTAYFFDEDVAREVNDEIKGVIDWRNTEGGEIAQRISMLSAEHRNAITSMIDHLAAYEQSPRARRPRRKPTSGGA